MDYKKIITDLGFTIDLVGGNLMTFYKAKYSEGMAVTRLELLITENNYQINVDMRLNTKDGIIPVCVRYEPRTESELVFLIKGSTRSLPFLNVPLYPVEG